jgi:hypothetical protein
MTSLDVSNISSSMIIHFEVTDAKVCTSTDVKDSITLSEVKIMIFVSSKQLHRDAVMLKTFDISYKPEKEVIITEVQNLTTSQLVAIRAVCDMNALFRHCREACESELKKASITMTETVCWKIGFAKHSKNETLLKLNNDKLPCGCIRVPRWYLVNEDKSGDLSFSRTTRTADIPPNGCQR